jgi:hypothetical protein
MTIRDSKGKFAKAAPFKAGDRVIALPHCGYGETVVGSTGTVLSHPNPSLGLLTLVAFLPDYPDGLHFYPNEIALSPSIDPEGPGSCPPDNLYRTEAELREATAERDRLKAELDLQKRIAEAALFREKFEARRAVAAESKLSDIAYIVRTWEIMRDGKTELPFMGAIKKVSGRKGA